MREKKRKNTPFLKKSPGEKSNTPLFFTILGLDFVARKVPLYRDILATRMRSFRPLSGGGGGAEVEVHHLLVIWNHQISAGLRFHNEKLLHDHVSALAQSPPATADTARQRAHVPLLTAQ